MNRAACGLFILSAALVQLAMGCCKKGDDEASEPVIAPVASLAPEDPADASPTPEPSASEVASATPEAPPTAPPTAVPPKPSARPPTNTSGANAVKACCSALASEASKAKGPDKNPYQSAGAVCNGLVKGVESGAVTPESAKLTIRAQLQRAKTIPGACR